MSLFYYNDSILENLLFMVEKSNCNKKSGSQ